MRRVLPPHAKISDEAKEKIQESVSEYISFITGEAKDHCFDDKRRTITAEDIIWAMKKLGFDDYAKLLICYLEKYREAKGEGFSRGLPPTNFAVPSVVAETVDSPICNMAVGYYGGMLEDHVLGAGASSSAQFQAQMPSFDPFCS